MDKSMNVELPYRSDSKVTLPSVARPYPNGQLPKELMHPCGIRNFKLVESAARSCRAMVTAALADGVRLDATGTYRTYERQEEMFTTRYSTSPIAGRRTKTWKGVQYWQKPNVAMAATPGNSNHGLGVALDFAQRSAGGALQAVGPATLMWLAEHGPRFGFWNSVKSEVWHWPFFLGDDIPDLVLEMEGSGKIRVPPSIPSDPQRRAAFYRGLSHEDVVSKGSKGVTVEAVQWALTLAGIVTDIDGNFGPATESSVKKFQQKRSLTVSGLVDHRTWTELGLLADRQRPQENTTMPAAKEPKKAPVKQGLVKPAPVKPAPVKQGPVARTGAAVAAAAAHRAGFRGDDLIAITMIAGRESRWQSDRVNSRTSDRGMWQINWKNLQRPSYDGLRARLGITSDTDLLDLATNAAVAFQMFQDSVSVGEPWFPWRGSEQGHTGSSPGWDPKGSHTWHTEDFAAEAKSAAAAVLDKAAAPTTSPKPVPVPVRKKGDPSGTYSITAQDSDGIVAAISRCLGIADQPWGPRRKAAEAVVEHNGASFVSPWSVGEVIRFPPTIVGVRSYTVKAGEGMLAIANGLGLGRSAAAQKRVIAINAWQGPTPHPGDTWYGGPAN